MNRLASRITFTDEAPVVVHHSNLFTEFTVYCFIFGETINAQMCSQFCQLFVCQLFAEELSDFFYFSSQVLLK